MRDNDRDARIPPNPNFGIHWNFTNEWHTGFVREFASSALPENIQMTAIRQLKVTHVLDNTKNGDVQLAKHAQTTHCVGQ